MWETQQCPPNSARPGPQNKRIHHLTRQEGMVQCGQENDGDPGGWSWPGADVTQGSSGQGSRRVRVREGNEDARRQREEGKVPPLPGAPRRSQPSPPLRLRTS